MKNTFTIERCKDIIAFGDIDRIKNYHDVKLWLVFTFNTYIVNYDLLKKFNK